MRPNGFYWIKRFSGGPWNVGLYEADSDWKDWPWDIIGCDHRFKDEELAVIGEFIGTGPSEASPAQA